MKHKAVPKGKMPSQKKKAFSLFDKALTGNNKLNTRQYDFKIVAALGFLLSLLLIIFCYKYFGSYFEMNDDPRYMMAMKGFATPRPYDNFVSVYKFTIYLYISLYKHFPGIGWYGLSMFLLLWGALFNFYLSFYLIAKKRISFLLINLAFIAFTLLIFLQNIYWINFTRPSILATASFVILLGALYLNNEVLRENKWILIFPSIIYILGHFTRLDGGYLGFITGFIFVFLLVLFQKKIFPFLLYYILPLLVFIIVIKIIDVYSQKNDPGNKDFLEKTEMIRQLIDYRNAAAYIPKDKIDTLTFNALMNARYCSDDKVITLDYIKKLTNKSPLLPNGNEIKFKSEFGDFKIRLDREYRTAEYIDISIILLFIIWFLSSVKANYKGFLKFFVYQVLAILILLAMSYFLKLPARIYTPLLVLFTTSNILFAFSMLRFEKKQLRLLYWLPVLATLVSIPVYIEANGMLLKASRDDRQFNTRFINNINSSFSNSIFIPTNLKSWEIHRNTDPIKEINLENGNCYVYLTIELSMAPETKDQLVSKFGTSDHSLLFKKISEMNNVIFISSKIYNNYLLGYYHYLYNQDYYFEKVMNEAPFFSEFTDLNYYRLRKKNG